MGKAILIVLGTLLLVAALISFGGKSAISVFLGPLGSTMIIIGLLMALRQKGENSRQRDADNEVNRENR